MVDLKKVIDWIALKYPFLASILRSIPIELVDDVDIAETDCKRIYVNREFVERSNLRGVAAALLHVALHAALQHCDARTKTFVGTWNIATDCVVNRFLQELGLEIPSDMHRYPGFEATVVTPEVIARVTGVSVDRVRRMCAEEIYHLLLRSGIRIARASDVRCSCSCGRGDGASVAKASDGSNLRDALRVAIELGLRAGLSGSALMELHYSLGTLPRTDWRKVIRNVASELGKGGYRYSWIKPSRKLGEDAMGRSRYIKPRNPLIYLLIDVSGSVVAEPQILNDFMNEVLNVAKQLSARVIVVAWDTDVVGVTEVSHREDPSAIADKIRKAAGRGGGGTVIDKAIEYAVNNFKELRKARRVREAAMIILTDGMIAKPRTQAIYEAMKLFKKILEVYTIEKSPLPYPAVSYSSLRM